MDHACIVIPILPGKTDAARAFQREVDTTRKADYARAERRLGVTQEYWFIAELPGSDREPGATGSGGDPVAGGNASQRLNGADIVRR